MKRFVNTSLLMGLVLLALPALGAETVQITINSSSPTLVGTGLIAQSGDRFLIQAEGALRLAGGRPFMDGWFDPSGLGSLERAGQVFGDSPFGILLGTWYGSLENGDVLGELAGFTAQGGFLGNELMLGLNMDADDQAALVGAFKIHVTRYQAEEADEVTLILDSDSPRPLGTGITMASGDKLLVVGQGAARTVGSTRPVIQGWFDASGLGRLRRAGQIFPDMPYGSLLATFNNLENGFYAGDAMGRDAQPVDVDKELKLALNMDADDQAGMEGAIVAHVLRINDAGISSAGGSVPGAGSIVGVQNYPNPFNPRTTIRFELGSAQMVRATVVDVSGRVVSELAAREFAAGSHELAWDGRDNTGRGLASGTYFLRLQAGQAIESHKLTLVQ